ncbi:phosphotransferase family protein [Catellatospora tritici]|uniref:phosphotransferase family protein n=1 Tax=Catellatospora tritici TaxID=2851566 RepID=UPI001C2D1D3D|nr:phosphotransferase family protein [Catellatospora tritici]MBV1850189.1 phosphotransferase family protein [Catellatospora tritici]
MSEYRDPPGIDTDRLAAYLRDALPTADQRAELAGPLRGELIEGGRSNLTYRLTDGTTRWVLRRPPLGHVLPTAHDMGREYRVIRALRDTGVPVPGTWLLCPDAEVIGSPFYLMDEVPGVVLRGEGHDPLTPEQARRCGRTLVDVLVALHAVDPAEVGLADFGKPDGYLVRQVAIWHKQWQRSITRELPGLQRLHDRLAAAVPDSGRAGIVHGDYRLDNVMFDPAVTRMLAVLDWEMCTLGDPLADVGLLHVYTVLAEQGARPGGGLAPGSGFPPAGQLTAWYAEATGVDLAQLDWYIAFAYYKLAIILEGIHARFLAGKTVGRDFETVGAMVPHLVEQGLSAAGE